MSYDLSGNTIAFLAADGFEQIELTQPWIAVEKAGGKPVLVSLKKGKITGFNHKSPADSFEVDITVEDAKAENFDGLMVPGGVHNPDTLRTNEKAVAFVKSFFEQHKPVASICHGPWILAEADVLENRDITSFNSIKTDLINAGANWQDSEVVVDNGLVTSRTPDDLEAFCSKMVEEFYEGKHRKQAA